MRSGRDVNLSEPQGEKQVAGKKRERLEAGDWRLVKAFL
jgi:hypothetical protein